MVREGAGEEMKGGVDDEGTRLGDGGNESGDDT